MDAKGSRAEVALVNLICFGPFAALALFRLVRAPARVLDDRELLLIGGIELLAGAIAILLLRARGWKLREFGLRPTFPETIFGMLLLIGATILIVFFNLMVTSFVGGPIAEPQVSVVKVSWFALILFSLVNPLYEEFFEVAYNLRAMSSREGAAFAISVSALVRLLCHIDQGPIAAFTILPLGVIFAAVYWRWGRVWPLVVAHGASDFFAMMPGGE